MIEPYVLAAAALPVRLMFAAHDDMGAAMIAGNDGAKQFLAQA
jgi:hypothetical protein